MRLAARVVELQCSLDSATSLNCYVIPSQIGPNDRPTESCQCSVSLSVTLATETVQKQPHRSPVTKISCKIHLEAPYIHCPKYPTVDCKFLIPRFAL